MDYFKVDATELRPEPAELQLIDLKRTRPILAEAPKSVDPAPIRRKRNMAIRGIEITAAASLLLNAVQAVIIYVLQAGPI